MQIKVKFDIPKSQAGSACTYVHRAGHRNSQGRIQLGSDAEVSSAQQAALDRILSRPGVLSNAGDLSTASAAQSIRCKTGHLQPLMRNSSLIDIHVASHLTYGAQHYLAVVTSKDQRHC